MKGEPLETTIYETIKEKIDSTQTNEPKRSKLDKYIEKDHNKQEIRAAIEDDPTNSNTSRISDRINTNYYPGQNITQQWKHETNVGYKEHNWTPHLHQHIQYWNLQKLSLHQAEKLYGKLKIQDKESRGRNIMTTNSNNTKGATNT
jgi:hypothetical protein